MKRHIWVLVVVAGIFVAVLMGVVYLRNNLMAAEVPSFRRPSETQWLSQGWTPEQRSWFYHADQGTQTFRIPYEWFEALDQPVTSWSFGIGGQLSDADYLDQYGFISASTGSGPPDVPIGFAHSGEMRHADGTAWLNPATHRPMTRLGLTCAACHTGRLTYRNTELVIDGGPALTNVIQFQLAVGKALAATDLSGLAHSRRFADFAERVLGPNTSSGVTAELKKELHEVVLEYEHVKQLEDDRASQGVEEGYARLDALNRIGNAVFAIDAGRDENYVAHSAPVHYPRIWNASWFEWVQYNGSIEQPMARNAGEALGVFAWLNLKDPGQRLFSSSVQGQTLFDIERTLAGAQPTAQSGFSGLTSPEWSDAIILPPIDTALASKGAVLYKDLCQGCHLPPTKSPDFWTSDRWLQPNAAGERHLDLRMFDIAEIGTDPAQAVDMQRRTVTSSPALGLKSGAFGTALGQVIELTMTRWYDDQNPPTPLPRREEINGNRPNGLRVVLQYKARPLNGIWATPPYLHNGSVPTLYALLSPVSERPRMFNLGNREFDPIDVGYRTDGLRGDFEFDTSRPGNSNAGHEFKDGPRINGVIGRFLTPDERRALVEFLKQQ